MRHIVNVILWHFWRLISRLKELHQEIILSRSICKRAYPSITWLTRDSPLTSRVGVPPSHLEVSDNIPKLLYFPILSHYSPALRLAYMWEFRQGLPKDTLRCPDNISTILDFSHYSLVQGIFLMNIHYVSRRYFNFSYDGFRRGVNLNTDIEKLIYLGQDLIISTLAWAQFWFFFNKR